MLTLKMLYKYTTPDRKVRSNYVRIVQMKAGRTDRGLGFVAAKTYSRFKVDAHGRLVNNTDPNHYVSMITFLDKRLHVHVACSCADTCYRWETANHYKDAAEIEYSTGDAPNVTNPLYVPGLCKHLVALYVKIKPKLPNG